ncbi:hypothetical protein [Gracilimonas amylolytica]|uniref:hypothetical protein n=1 Tax=Gracilimonas amylolytica TaxID=1749045 RepID=UPI000CD9B6C9|nr:hypothetical protein [Gracilimonas amylolytica]
MLKSFQEEHPAIFNAIIIGTPSLIIFLLIIVTDPFEFSTLELANRLIVYVMIFILSLFGGLLFGGLIKWMMSRSVR